MAKIRFEGYIEDTYLDVNGAREILNNMCDTTRDKYPVNMDIDAWYKVD